MRMPDTERLSTLTNGKVPWKTPAEEAAAHQDAVAAQLGVWREHLPKLLQRFAKIPDPRHPSKVLHKATVLLFYALVCFLFQYRSRREANREATGPTLAATFRQVFPEIDSIPHFDTVERFLETIPEATWDSILHERIQHLLAQPKVRQFLVEQAWVVAVDGSQKFARHQPWDPKALRQKFSESDTRYRVYILEAVLVSPNGLTLPLISEFCENAEDDSEDTKQDSELKAFRRLAKRLKEWFPRRRLLIVLDGLYPSGPVFQLCRAYHWDYMIILPAECLKTVWEDAEGLHQLDTDGQYQLAHRWGDHDQQFWWANEIEYDFRQDGQQRQIHVHVVVCDETWTDGKGTVKHGRWAWISAQPITPPNVLARCNRAGRHRWDIESNLLVEKRWGYHYEHAYAYDWTAMKGWHYCMKLAHLLNVLTLWTKVGDQLRHWRGNQGTIRFLRETWTGRWLDTAFFQAFQAGNASP